MESPRTPVTNQMSRSEREVEASRALNEWYIQPFIDSDLSRIEYIHTQMCEQWSSPYGRDNSDDWIDGSYGIYWSKTVSLKKLENYKTSYGFVIGNHISHIKFGTKKMLLDKNKFNGFEFQPVLFTILSSNVSFYKKDESNKRLLGLGFGFGL